MERDKLAEFYKSSKQIHETIESISAKAQAHQEYLKT